MQEFLCLLRPTRIEMLVDAPTESEMAAVQAHFEYWQRLEPKLAGRTQSNDEKTFGIIVFEATDLAAAEECVNSDPAVSEKVMTAEVHPFVTAILEKAQK